MHVTSSPYFLACFPLVTSARSGGRGRRANYYLPLCDGNFHELTPPSLSLRKPSLVLFRTRHIEGSSRGKIVETAEEEEEDDDGIEDQFVSLWLDIEDGASAVGGDEVVWRVVGRGSSEFGREERWIEGGRNIEMQRGLYYYMPTFCMLRSHMCVASP